jgi:hypothetical protein
MAVPLPPLNLNQSSSAKTGDLASQFGSDGSGFSVNFGNGVSQGNSTPTLSPLMIGALVLVALVWMKKK